MERPLMPKATAVWLVDNTSLTFLQIAEFCGLHELEIRGIADGEVARGIKGLDPLSTGQLSREELERCSKDSNARLELTKKEKILTPVKKRRPKYTPLSKRKDKPDAISWLIRNHPEIKIFLSTNDNKVKVIELSRNFGHHKAIMTGLSHAVGEKVFFDRQRSRGRA